MRILFLVNARFPTEKAYGIQIEAMGRGFAQLHEERDATAIAFPKRQKVLTKKIDGVELISFGWQISLAIPGMFQCLRLLGALQSLRVVSTWKPDIVIINDPLQAAVHSLNSKAKIIWDLHDIPNLAKWSHRFLVKIILKRASGIVSTNQLKIDALKDQFGILPPITILPNPPAFPMETYRSISRESARKSVGIGKDEKIIVYAGQLFDWKGVDTLIRSAEFAPQNVCIHIIGGTGADLDRAKKIAAAIPHTGASIFFHGQQLAQAIPQWLRSADLIAIPNSGKFDISRRDTNPMKLQEAAAAEVPVLASDLPSIKESVYGSEAVLFAPADDPQAWGKAITDFFSLSRDMPEWKKIQRAAQGAAWILSPEQRALALRQFFAKLP